MRKANEMTEFTARNGKWLPEKPKFVTIFGVEFEFEFDISMYDYEDDPNTWVAGGTVKLLDEKFSLCFEPKKKTVSCTMWWLLEDELVDRRMMTVRARTLDECVRKAEGLPKRFLFRESRKMTIDTIGERDR